MINRIKNRKKNTIAACLIVENTNFERTKNRRVNVTTTTKIPNIPPTLRI